MKNSPWKRILFVVDVGPRKSATYKVGMMLRVLGGLELRVQ